MARRSRGKKRRGAGGSRRGGMRFRGTRRRAGAGRRGGGVRKFKAAIRKIGKMPAGLQVQAMRAANDNFIRCMCRAVRKLKNKRLSPKVTAGMKRNSKKIRKLINPKTSMSVKRNMLSRSGGFLPLLLAGLAGSTLSGLLGRR